MIWESQSFKSYPRVYLFMKGTKVEEYGGERDWSEIVDYVRREADPKYTPPESAVVTLAADNFTQFAKEQRLMMVCKRTKHISLHQKYIFCLMQVLFYAPWCEHCKAMMPAYESAARELKEIWGIPLAKVDGVQDKELADRYGAAGWPTLKVFNRGVVFGHAGSRDKKSLVAAMKHQARPALTEVKYDYALEATLKRADTTNVVGYFKEKSSPMYGQLAKAANELRESNFNMMCTFNASYEANVVIVHLPGHLVTDFEQPSYAFKDEKATAEKIVKFIKDKSFPLVDHRTRGNPRNGHKPQLVAYFKADFGYHYRKDTEYVRDMVAAVAKEHVGAPLRFAIADVDELADELRSLGLADNEDDVRVAVLGDGGSKYVMPPLPKDQIFSPDHLRAFIKSLRSGEIEPVLKSEPVPESQNATSAVRVLVAKSYTEEVHNSDRDAIVFFHAPWCGHCMEFGPKYEELAAKSANKTSSGRHPVAFFKIDGTANDAPPMFPTIQGYPTIFFVKAADKMNPVQYSGDRSLKSLRKFIKANRTPEKVLANLKFDEHSAAETIAKEFKAYFEIGSNVGIKDEL